MNCQMLIATIVFGHKITDNFSASVCATGTEGNGTGCTPCPPWAYHPGGMGGPVSCTPCPIGNIAPSLATSSEQCYGKFYFLLNVQNMGKKVVEQNLK